MPAVTHTAVLPVYNTMLRSFTVNVFHLGFHLNSASGGPRWGVILSFKTMWLSCSIPLSKSSWRHVRKPTFRQIKHSYVTFLELDYSTLISVMKHIRVSKLLKN